MPADGQGVVLLELTPPFRTFTFAAKDRPEAPVEVGGEQRATQTWYPGASKASVQVMGVREHGITLKGWFHDDLTALDGGPERRVALLRELMYAGSLIQLLWGTVIIRTGRIASVKAGIYQARRQRYEVQFAVDQSNEPAALGSLVPVAAVASDAAAALAAARAAAETAIAAVDTVKTIGSIVL